MRFFSIRKMIPALLFIALNLADALVTQQLLAHGGGEGNIIVIAYGSNLLIKGLLAAALVASLMAIRKAHLLKVLNICMVAVVLWTGGWTLTYL